MTHIIICTGRPASGKTTLLKELEMGDNAYHYTNADAILEPIIMKLSKYHGKIQLLDRLFMDTNSLLHLLEAMGDIGHNKLTIYSFEDNKEQCLENDKLRPKERRTAATIDKPYYIDFGLLIKEYPGIDFKIIDMQVYKPAEWELFFASKSVELDYKVNRFKYNKLYEIVPGRVNKRYIISDYWLTDVTEKCYDNDWNAHWETRSDDEPLEFTELDNILSSIPGLTFNQALEIKKLAEVVSFYVSDYYLEAVRYYHCIDAEKLYNKLIELDLIKNN